MKHIVIIALCLLCTAPVRAQTATAPKDPVVQKVKAACALAKNPIFKRVNVMAFEDTTHLAKAQYTLDEPAVLDASLPVAIEDINLSILWDVDVFGMYVVLDRSYVLKTSLEQIARDLDRGKTF